MNLQEEAKKYAKETVEEENYGDDTFSCAKDSFEEGATSKYVKSEKLKFAIEQLKECTNVSEYDWDFCVTGRKIKELQQQLKDLENE